jgi:hypothetical protein
VQHFLFLRLLFSHRGESLPHHLLGEEPCKTRVEAYKSILELELADNSQSGDAVNVDAPIKTKKQGRPRKILTAAETESKIFKEKIKLDKKKQKVETVGMNAVDKELFYSAKNIQKLKIF